MSNRSNHTPTTSRVSNRTFGYAFLTTALLVVIFVLFLFSSSPSYSFPHWLLLFEPLVNINFVNEIWFGVDLPKAPFTGERFIAFGLGVVYVVSVIFVGRLLVLPIQKRLEFNRLETIFFSTGLGLVIGSTFLAIAGLLGHAQVSLLPICLGIVVFSILYMRIQKFVSRRRAYSNSESLASGKLLHATINNKESEKTTFKRCVFICQVILLFLFSSFYLFAATQPLFEYDAVEYHAQGAREIYESGQIVFSPHNAYLNMPLGAEMFYVSGFNIAQDAGFKHDDVLRIGALVGKTILISFSLLTAFGIVAFCIRFFGNLSMGLWGAIFSLSFPQFFEVFSNGLNDGVLSFTLFAVFYSTVLSLRLRLNRAKSQRGVVMSSAILLGVFAGFATAVKYTGVFFILAPTGAALSLLIFYPKLLQCFFPDAQIQDCPQTTESEDSSVPNDANLKTKGKVLSLFVFIFTVAVIGGGWYLRNTFETGNPVYPLGYSLFGDSTGSWNDSIDERWRHAHSTDDFSLKAINKSVVRSFFNDDFISPFFPYLLIFGLATILLPSKMFVDVPNDSLSPRVQRSLRAIFGLIVVFWLGWFLVTHRLTRFLTPMFPLGGVFLGVLFASILAERNRIFRSVTLGVVFVALLYSGLTIDLIGQGRMAPLRGLEHDPMRFPPEVIYFNERPELFEQDRQTDISDRKLDSDTRPIKLLLIGEAKAFLYRVPVLYSTCWNDSPFMSALKDCVERTPEGKIVKIQNPSKIVDNLKTMQVGYILVNFAELERFRSEGNYGFNNPEIDVDLFALLLQTDVLELYEVPDIPEDRLGTVQVFKVR